MNTPPILDGVPRFIHGHVQYLPAMSSSRTVAEPTRIATAGSLFSFATDNIAKLSRSNCVSEWTHALLFSSTVAIHFVWFVRKTSFAFNRFVFVSSHEKGLRETFDDFFDFPKPF